MTEHLARAERRNRIVAVVGKKGSGKSFLLDGVFVAQHDRVITIDQTGEAAEAHPGALYARGLVNTYNAIGELHAQAWRGDDGPGRWHLITALDVPEVLALFDRLAPSFSDNRRSLSVVLGGVCVQCDEIDVIAPASGTAPEFTQAIARGRHHRLSLLLATRRPAECSRMISSQADMLVSFAMHEPRDVRWLRDSGGEAFAAAVRHLPRYSCAVLYTDTGTVEVWDRNRNVRRIVDGLADEAPPRLPLP